MKILNQKSKIINSDGFVISIVTFFILVIMMSIAVSMSYLIFYRQRISTNIIKSSQSYYTAEAGAEDALLALRNNPSMAAKSYTLTINDTTASIVIPGIVGGSRTITSDGNASNIIRKLQVVYSIDSQGVGFHYGVQVGEGGLTMNNGSRVQGNVFSNGNISGGSGTINNNVVVAGNGNSIKDITVNGDALSYSCLSPALIKGNLTYVVGGTRTCTVQGSISTQPDEVPPQPLPISQTQIDNWKSEASAGGTHSGDYNLSGGSASIGPKKITGSLTVSNQAILTVTGTLWVLGDITITNESTVKLSSSYGSLSGLIIGDSKISVTNEATIRGSGNPSSYIMLLAAKDSILEEIITVSNESIGVIYYAGRGHIKFSNEARAKEATAYGIILDNESVITYESGLANTFFTTGPSGGWKVRSWEEK